MKSVRIESHSRKILNSALRNHKSAIMLGVVLFALCVPAEAQQSKTVPRIGYLSSADRASDSTSADGDKRFLTPFSLPVGPKIPFPAKVGEG